MNTPNKITILRICLVPVFLLAYTVNIPYRYLIALCIFAAAAVTDSIDGHLARKRNIVTVFGQFLDPVADKLLVAAGLLAFLSDGLCSVWIAMLILGRELLITSFRMIAAAQNVVIPANLFGKIKTVMQMVSFFLILLLCGISEIRELPLNIVLISNVLLGISAGMGAVSAGVYLRQGWNLIDFKK